MAENEDQEPTLDHEIEDLDMTYSNVSGCDQDEITYSEGQNRSTKGQISLVSQIVAQRTKGKLWENCMTRVGILYFVMPNDRHLASFVDFILTLQWDQCSGTVLSLPLKVALYTWIT